MFVAGQATGRNPCGSGLFYVFLEKCASCVKVEKGRVGYNKHGGVYKMDKIDELLVKYTEEGTIAKEAKEFLEAIGALMENF